MNKRRAAQFEQLTVNNTRNRKSSDRSAPQPSSKGIDSSKETGSAAALALAGLHNHEALMATYSRGAEFAEALTGWFGNAANQSLLQDLQGLDFCLKAQEASAIAADGSGQDGKPKFLVEETLVLKCVLPTLKRSQAQELIEVAGGKMSDSMSKTNSYVMANVEAGSKLSKDEQLCVAILAEAALLALLL
jgi:DNA ligase (NAD+)